MSILFLLIASDSTHNGFVNFKLLDVTQFKIVAKFYSVQGEENGRKDSPLRRTNAADHSVGCDVLKTDELWCVGEIMDDALAFEGVSPAGYRA